MRKLVLLFCIFCLMLSAGCAKSVSKEEYDQLKEENENLKQAIEVLQVTKSFTNGQISCTYDSTKIQPFEIDNTSSITNAVAFVQKDGKFTPDNIKNGTCLYSGTLNMGSIKKTAFFMMYDSISRTFIRSLFGIEESQALNESVNLLTEKNNMIEYSAETAEGAHLKAKILKVEDNQFTIVVFRNDNSIAKDYETAINDCFNSIQ